jgi:serine protease
MWYGHEIYTKYDQIYKIVSGHLGQEAAELFSRPVITDEALQLRTKALWLSSILANPQPLVAVGERERAAYETKLAALLDAITSLGRTLRESSDREQKQIGEVLQLAVEVPGLESVLVDNGRIALVCWGFHASNPEQARFRLLKALTRSAAQPPPPQPVAAAQSQPGAMPALAAPRTLRRPLWMLGGLAIAGVAVVMVAFLLWTPRASLPSSPGFSPADPARIMRYDQDPLGRRIVINRLLVTLKDGIGAAAFMRRLQASSAADGIRFVGYRPEIGVVQVEFEVGRIESVKALFQADPDVDGVAHEAVADGQTQASLPPGGTEFKNWGLDYIGAPAAWRATAGVQATLVAIVDTGFAPAHPDLANRTQATYRSITGTATLGPSRTGGGHGTHVAGIAGAASDTAAGTSGVCPGCGLMLVDAADDQGNLAFSAIIDGIESATNRGARIINLSLGTDSKDKFRGMTQAQLQSLVPPIVKATRGDALIWDRVYGRAEQAKALIVVAAGNDNAPMELDPMKRSSLPLYVGALDRNGRRAAFSNFGAEVGVSAPGVDIYSTLPDTGFGSMNGTSMAAPFVAGAAGLLLTAAPGLSPAELRRVLKETGRAVQPDGDGQRVGPAIDVAKAIAQVAPAAPSPPTPPTPPPVTAPKPSPAVCSCEETARKLGELERRLAEMERRAAAAPPPASVPAKPQEKLTIPDQPTTDLRFAEGRWRASENLVRSNDQQAIQLVFEIQSDGAGRITYEEPGSTCPAPLTLSFKNRELSILQQTDAPCSTGKSRYERYQFVCVADSQHSAKCTAKDLSGTSTTLVDFFMERER